MKTVLYARCSIKGQKNSIGMQLDVAWEKAKQLGIVIDEFYLDEAISASKTEIKERPQLVRLLEDIQNKKIQKLLVYKRDRLARNVLQYMYLLDVFKNHQVHVIFTSENELPIQTSPAGEFFELLMSGFAEREANQIAQRIKEGKSTLIKDGKNPGGRLPFGYKTDTDKTIIPDPDQSKIIEQIFQELLESPCTSFSEFLEILNGKKLYDKKPWEYNRLRDLLENPVYKGIRYVEQFGSRFHVVNEKLRIIPETIWDKAQQQLELLINKREKQSIKIVSSLDGLLFCDRCNNMLKAKQKKLEDGTLFSYYSCKDHNYKMYPIEALEELILNASIEFVKQHFKTNFNVFFDTLYTQELQTCQQYIKEAQQKVREIQKKILETSRIWLENPNAQVEKTMIKYHDDLRKEELVMEVYQRRLSKLITISTEKIADLAESIPLETEIFRIKEEWSTLFSDLIQSVYVWNESLKITFKLPYGGTAGAYEFTAS